MRGCGILLPVLSLPSRYGIGCFSKEALEFIDFLKASGQGYWQILPIGPTGFGDSPYQPLSAFAGNPYFISPEELIQDGLLEAREADTVDFGSDPESVDYGALYNERHKLLRLAYRRFLDRGLDRSGDYLTFCETAKSWLDDYCLFTVLKEMHQGAGWLGWELPYRSRDPKALEEVTLSQAEAIGFIKFEQFLFDKQWKKIRNYAARQGIRIIGDIPFYVSMDSTDAWAHPEAFCMTKDYEPELVAGCPPDAFSATGQLWGNPVYNWAALKRDHYRWWVDRIQRSYELYDVIRIDHFHGFAEYYAIPYGDATAEHGTAMKGPGMDFFNLLKASIPELMAPEDGSEAPLRMIAEDLGTVTAENQKLLADTGFPGMKILQYAFTSWNSIYIPYQHERNYVVYPGTHDNPTVRQWLEEINDGTRDFVRRYINSMNTDYGALTWDFIREAYRSVADLCIIPLQDYLVYGAEARMNCPGTQGSNWKWRLKPHFLSKELASSICGLSALYGRKPAEKKN